MMKVAVYIALAGLALSAPASFASGTATPLFNGKDLSGWKAFCDKNVTGGYSAAEPTWFVANGAIRTTGTPFGYLRTEREDFDKCVISLEYRWWRETAKPNSGIFVKLVKDTGCFIPKCYENQLCRGSAGDILSLGGNSIDGIAPMTPFKEGDALSGIAKAPKLRNDSEKPFGEWNRLVIELNGKTIKNWLNGVAQNNIEGASPGPGAIALQSEGGAIEFRNITVEPLYSRLEGEKKFKLESKLVGDIAINNAGGNWIVSGGVKTLEKDVEIVTLHLDAKDTRRPEPFEVFFSVSSRGIDSRYITQNDNIMEFKADWMGSTGSSLASGYPLMSYISHGKDNRLTVACSEAIRRMEFTSGVNEGNSRVNYKAKFFADDEAPISSYDVEFRIDCRDIGYVESIGDVVRWFESMPLYRPAKVPSCAIDPLYSFWYSYHQNLTTANVEKECSLAPEYGMKTLILDDGWQTDNNWGGYAYCGDWEVSKKKFADFAGHIKKVQSQNGMKYVVWYSLPFVGFKSKNYERFKGKYLYDNKRLGASILDPRFPEVREFLINIYENAVKDWNLDGFKLDFIDNFRLPEIDPAIAENYAGRDIKSVPMAVDRLMTDIIGRLTALKPDILIEFRQTYIGPAMRKYGNMFRAADCPQDLLANRKRTISLRLTSGDTAVHSDMLMWSKDDDAAAAIRQLLAVYFSVPQISVRLDEIPASHKEMLKYHLDFWTAHRDTLLRGRFDPRHPELNFPAVYAYGKDEQVVVVYDENQVVDLKASNGKSAYIVNATSAGVLAVRKDGKLGEVAVSPSRIAQVVFE